MRCPTLAELPPPPPDKTGWPWTEETASLPETMPDGSPWPRISIVTPSYNQGQFIEETIRSALLQGYPNLEYIIIDGGSTDNSVEIIKKYESWLAYWVSEKDRGVYDAMNKAIKYATGDWLYFLGADDILVNCLHKVSSFLRRKDTIYYGDVYLPHKNKTYAGQFRWHTLVSKNINHQSIFYPRQVFECCSYNLKYSVYADYDLNLRCWGDGRFVFRYMPILVAIHHDGGLSHQKTDEAFERDKPALVQKYFGKRIALRLAWFRLRSRVGGFLRREK